MNNEPPALTLFLVNEMGNNESTWSGLANSIPVVLIMLRLSLVAPVSVGRVGGVDGEGDRSRESESLRYQGRMVGVGSSTSSYKICMHMHN